MLFRLIISIVVTLKSSAAAPPPMYKICTASIRSDAVIQGPQKWMFQRLFRCPGLASQLHITNVISSRSLALKVREIRAVGESVAIAFTARGFLDQAGYHSVTLLLVGKHGDRYSMSLRLRVLNYPYVSDSKFVNLDAEEHLTPGGVMVVNLDAENIKDSRSVLPVPLVMSIKCGDSYLVNDKGEKIIDDHCEWINSVTMYSHYAISFLRKATASLTLNYDELRSQSIASIHPCFLLRDNYHNYSLSYLPSRGSLYDRVGANEQTYCLNIATESLQPISAADSLYVPFATLFATLFIAFAAQ